MWHLLRVLNKPENILNKPGSGASSGEIYQGRSSLNIGEQTK